MKTSSLSAVVIGASAGGVDAINAVFAALRKPLPLPVLVVLHTPPQGSIVLGAFRSYTQQLKFKEAEDKETLAPGTVYFAPPNYHLLVEQDRTLSLSVDEPVFFARPSIDILFESAQEAFGPSLLGILLTGANEDGARGLKKIHEGGGITVVQEPSTAQCGTMPDSALRLFRPTYTLTLEQIADLLLTLAERPG